MAPEGFGFATSFPGDPVDLVLVLVDVLVGGCGDPAVEQKAHIWVLGAGSAFLTHASNDTPGGCPKSSAERLIDCEEDRTLRAVLVGMLQEMERR